MSPAPRALTSVSGNPWALSGGLSRAENLVASRQGGTSCAEGLWPFQLRENTSGAASQAKRGPLQEAWSKSRQCFINRVTRMLDMNVLLRTCAVTRLRSNTCQEWQHACINPCPRYAVNTPTAASYFRLVVRFAGVRLQSRTRAPERQTCH